MKWLPGENRFIDTVITATLAGVYGSFQVRQYTITTSRVDDNLVIKMTSTEVPCKQIVREVRYLNLLEVVVRRALMNMAVRLMDMADELDDMSRMGGS